MNTRGLQGLTAGRISSETVTLIYPKYTDSADGSAEIKNNEINSPASVGILQARDIERLEKAGIIVRAGVTIVVPRAQENPPDKIIHGKKSYRVVEWAITHEGNNKSVIATCDEITIQGA